MYSLLLSLEAAEGGRISPVLHHQLRIREVDGDMIVVMAMEDRTELRLVYQAREEDLYIGVPATSDACPAAS